MQLTLKNKTATATAETFGGELASYFRSGTEYVWTGDPAYWTGRAPVLFPIVGALKDGMVTYQGRAISMPKHGVARKREFVLESRTEDSVTFVLEADEESLKLYPFRFRLAVTHRLTESGFVTTYDVTNADDAEMPFCIGGHPGFRCPLNPGEQFEEYELILDENETIPALYTDAGTLLVRDTATKLIQNGRVIPLRYADFDRDAFILDGLTSRGVSLRHKKTKRGLRLSFEGFSALGVWTPPGKRAPFLCLEPWAGLPAEPEETGDFLDKPYVQVLKKGMTRSFWYQADILE